MTGTSRGYLSKSWVWGGRCFFWVTIAQFQGRKTVGPDVRHVPQGAAGALPAVGLHSQGIRILPPAET